jgi:hypothetical protein
MCHYVGILAAIAGSGLARKSGANPTYLLADRISQNRAGVETRIVDEKNMIFLLAELAHEGVSE